MDNLAKITKLIEENANSEVAKNLQRFFKTGPGQYGEGDIFVGLKNPQVRAIVKQFKNLDLPTIEKLLHSKIHEERLVALIIMVEQAKKADKQHYKQLFDLYLKNTKYINNWDLVDLSSKDVVGGYSVDRPRDVLYKLAKSNNIWDRRIAIISTAKFIGLGDFADTIAISKLLLDDKHDLIHKAVGWMLREVGKRDTRVLHEFLDKHACDMPRTKLRYSIERLSEDERKKYLAARGEKTTLK
ncbi:MAG: DNA alkylation repair protein [Candidatus Woesebacteria bacterium]|jgi:3-methyladenine DNA glycosylase AlkD